MISNQTDRFKGPIQYRADIDGLRAVAVLLVLGFHAFPTRVPGGFVGVDIFFVISGYLISGIIFRDLENGRFSFRQFYARRVRRIVPALILVLAFSFLVGWWVLLPDEYMRLNKHIASAAGFFSNFTLWNEAGYFDEAADTKPLQHLWSLAIEEQFYICWPLMLTVVWARKWKISWVIMLVGGLSFVANVVTINQSHVSAFYSPVCRIWELMMGAQLAYWVRDERQPLPPGLSDGLAVAGLALICAAVALITGESAFPGWLALLPTTGTLCIILAGSSRLDRVVLASRPLVWLGLVSYPLYLWHWPLLVFAQLVFGRLGGIQKISILAISFGLAVLTYLVVESPIRRHFSFRLAGALAACLVATLAVSSITVFDNLLPRQHDESISKLLAAAEDWDFPDGSERRISAGKLTRVTSYKSRVPGTTIFIGDSTAEQYYPRVAKLIDDNPDRVNSAIFVGNQERNCQPAPRLFMEAEQFCHFAIHDVRDLALAKTTVAVALSYSGDNYLALMQSERGRENLARFVRLLTEGRKRVYIILNIPEGWEMGPRLMYVGSRLTKLVMKPVDQISFDAKTYFGQYAAVREALRNLAAENGAAVVDPMDVLCRNGRCPALDGGGNPLYRDGFHLRASYARSAASYIDVTLLPVAQN